MNLLAHTVAMVVAASAVTGVATVESDQPVSSPGDQPAPRPVPNSRSPPRPWPLAQYPTVSTVPSTSRPVPSAHDPDPPSAYPHACRPGPRPAPQ